MALLFATGPLRRRSLAVSLISVLVVALVSGCVAGTVEQETPPVPDAGDLSSRVLRTTLVTLTGIAGEPSVAVDADGVIYVTGPGSNVCATDVPAVGLPRCVPEPSRLWVSTDDGETFALIPVVHPSTGVSNLPHGREGDVAIDEAGNAYFVDFYGANTQLSASEDQGKTWMMRSPAVFQVPEGDRPWLAAGPERMVAVAWNQDATGFWIAVSTDGGESFPVQTNLAGSGLVDDGTSFAGVPRIAPDGTIYATRLVDPVVTDDEAAWGPTLYRSTDGGRTLTTHLVHPTANRTGWLFIAPAIDAAGNVYVAWAETDGERLNAWFSMSADQGDTWRAPVQVGAHEGTNAMPWISAGATGHIAIAYYGAPNATGDPDAVEGDVAWFPYVVDVVGADTDAPQQSTTRLSDAPVLHGPMCMAGLNCAGGGASRALGDYLMVDIGPDETIHTTWTHLTDDGPVIWWAQSGRS